MTLSPTTEQDTYHDWDDWDDWDADDGTCQTCGGDGITECDDYNSSEGCWEPDCDGRSHTCPNCRGSGRAADQTYW